MALFQIICKSIKIQQWRSSKLQICTSLGLNPPKPWQPPDRNEWDSSGRGPKSLTRKGFSSQVKGSPLSTSALVCSQQSDGMSRWRRNFRLLFLEYISFICHNEQLRLITLVTRGLASCMHSSIVARSTYDYSVPVVYFFVDVFFFFKINLLDLFFFLRDINSGS